MKTSKMEFYQSQGLDPHVNRERFGEVGGLTDDVWGKTSQIPEFLGTR